MEQPPLPYLPFQRPLIELVLCINIRCLRVADVRLFHIPAFIKNVFYMFVRRFRREHGCHQLSFTKVTNTTVRLHSSNCNLSTDTECYTKLTSKNLILNLNINISCNLSINQFIHTPYTQSNAHSYQSHSKPIGQPGRSLISTKAASNTLRPYYCIFSVLLDSG